MLWKVSARFIEWIRAGVTLPDKDIEKKDEDWRNTLSVLIGALHAVGALFFEGCLSRRSLLAQSLRLTLLAVMTGTNEEELSGYPIRIILFSGFLIII